MVAEYRWLTLYIWRALHTNVHRTHKRSFTARKSVAAKVASASKQYNEYRARDRDRARARDRDHACVMELTRARLA